MTVIVVCTETLSVSSEPKGTGTSYDLERNQVATSQPRKTSRAAIQSPMAPSQAVQSDTPLRLPIVISSREVSSTRAARHERDIFNWHPEFNVHDPAFDLHNRPYIRMRTADVRAMVPGKIQRLAGSSWEEYNFFKDILAHFQTQGDSYTIEDTPKANGWMASIIAFDRSGWAYTILRVDLRRLSDGQIMQMLVLLYSLDGAGPWKVLQLPMADEFEIELPSSPDPLLGPPAIALWQRASEAPRGWERTYGTLTLVTLKKQNNSLIQDKQVRVSEQCYGLGSHAGGASRVITYNGKIYIVWAENVPGTSKAKGTGSPNKIAVYTQAEGLSQVRTLHNSLPANDSHAQPGLVVDSKGRLHVITGGHASHFFYLTTTKSVHEPDFNLMSDWTQPQPILTEPNRKTCLPNTPGLPGGCQSYLAFLRDRQDTLHIVYRQMRVDFNGQHGQRAYNALAYQKKPASAGWSKATVLVVPPMAGYWNYHHHMTMDSDGRIFATYTHSDTSNESKARLPYSDIPMFQFSTMLSSADAGETWRLVTTNTFRAGLH